MLKVVDGVPGSGKSYFMVHYLSKFFTYDKFYETFHINDSHLIISNIEGLRIPHMVLDGPEILGNPEKGIEGKYTRETFFTIPNFEKLMSVKKVKNVILMIDECQKEWLFPAGYKNPDVMYFFQYHRHLGIDLTLGTQDAKLICRHALVCAEYIARATARSKSIMGNFSYKFHDLAGNFLYSKVLRKSNDIFRAYKSMTTDEITKPKNAILYWASLFIVLIVVAIFLFKFALSTVKDKGKPKPSATSSTKTPVAAPVLNQYTAARYRPPIPTQQNQPVMLNQSNFPPGQLNSNSFNQSPGASIPEKVYVIGVMNSAYKEDVDTSSPPVQVQIKLPLKSTRYLLSNGLIVQSKKRYFVDDEYKG